MTGSQLARTPMALSALVAQLVRVVDLDDQATWPEGVKGWVSNYPAYAELGYVDTRGLRASFAGVPVRAYHCTRLLDDEVANVRERGLELLTPGLVERRLCSAENACPDLNGPDLRRSTVYAKNVAKPRDGVVYFFLGRSCFDDDPSEWDWLLSLWGGESINMYADVHHPRLRTLGKPTIVVTRIDLGQSQRIRPELSQLVVDVARGKKAKAGVRHGVPVSGSDVIDIWQPGHPEYDRHSQLPR